MVGWVTLESRLRFLAIMLSLAAFAAGAAQAGNAANGAVVFQRCALCHSADKNGGNGVGPNLYGVAGRKAASLPDFPYSPALKKSGITWTDAKLKAWVSGPARVVPGTRMTFAGLSDPRQADDVVAYLHTKK